MATEKEYMLKQADAETTYQKKLVAGTNITINPVTNEISAAGGGSTVTYAAEYSVGDLLGTLNINGTANLIKMPNILPGNNISITRDAQTGAITIASTGGSGTIIDVMQENVSVVDNGIAYVDKNHIWLDEDGVDPGSSLGADFDLYISKVKRIDPEVDFVEALVWQNDEVTKDEDEPIYEMEMSGTGNSNPERATYAIHNLEVGATYGLSFNQQISSSATFYNQHPYGTCISETTDGAGQSKAGYPGTYDEELRFFSYNRDTDEHSWYCEFEATQETMYLVTFFGDVYDGTNNTFTFSDLTVKKIEEKITDLWFKVPSPIGWIKFAGGGASNTSVRILNSKAEWDALPNSKYTDNVIYVIKGSGGGVVKGVVANPSGEPVANLSAIGIDGYIYNIDNGGASGSETVLVEDYEYCNFAGSGYIVLPQKINADYKITVDFNIPAYDHNMGLIGHNNNDDDYLHVTQYTSGNDRWYMSTGSSETSFTNKPLTGRHTIVINDGTNHNTFDGDNVTNYTPTNANYNLTIGTSQGTQTDRLVGQIYSYKIESIANQTVIADLIPRKVTYDGATISEGLYDKISGNYYSCNGCTVGGTHSEPAGYNIYVGANPQKTATQTLNKIQIGGTTYQVEVASQGDNTVVPNPQGTPVENLNTLGFVREIKDYCLNNGLVAAPGGSYIYCNLDVTMTIDKTYQVILRDGDNTYTSNFTWAGTNTSLNINGMTLAITSSQVGLTYYSGDYRNIYCDIYTIENETIVYQVMGSGGGGGSSYGTENPSTDGNDGDIYYLLNGQGKKRALFLYKQDHWDCIEGTPKGLGFTKVYSDAYNTDGNASATITINNSSIQSGATAANFFKDLKSVYYSNSSTNYQSNTTFNTFTEPDQLSYSWTTQSGSCHQWFNVYYIPSIEDINVLSGWTLYTQTDTYIFSIPPAAQSLTADDFIIDFQNVLTGNGSNMDKTDIVKTIVNNELQVYLPVGGRGYYVRILYSI